MKSLTVVDDSLLRMAQRRRLKELNTVLVALVRFLSMLAGDRQHSQMKA